MTSYVVVTSCEELGAPGLAVSAGVPAVLVGSFTVVVGDTTVVTVRSLPLAAKIKTH